MPRMNTLKHLFIETLLLLGMFVLIGHMSVNIWERYLLDKEIANMKSSLYQLKSTVNHIGNAYEYLNKEFTEIADATKRDNPTRPDNIHRLSTTGNHLKYKKERQDSKGQYEETIKRKINFYDNNVKFVKDRGKDEVKYENSCDKHTNSPQNYNPIHNLKFNQKDSEHVDINNLKNNMVKEKHDTGTQTEIDNFDRKEKDNKIITACVNTDRVECNFRQSTFPKDASTMTKFPSKTICIECREQLDQQNINGHCRSKDIGSVMIRRNPDIKN